MIFDFSGRPQLFLYGNPLSCDCYLDWLPSINDEPQRQLLPKISDLDDLECYNHGGVGLMTLRRDQFLCPYETHCFDLCMCCDFYACDCRMQCPYGCECEHDLSWSRNVVRCSDKNHTHVPVLIPMDATVVHLDGNRLHYVDQQNFLGRQRVQHLFLNNSGVARLGEAAFTGLSDLRVLYLEDNKLGELRGDEFIGLARLKELYLQHNALTSISEVTFEPLISLQTLRLDGNLLMTFQVWKVVAGNQLLASISLSENMWSCSCEFIAPFSDFLERKKDTIADYESVICVSSRESLQVGEPCPTRKSMTQSVAGITSEAGNEALELATILVPSTLAIIMVVIGFLAVCVFRKSINSWIYGKSSEIYESNNARLNTIYNNNGSNSGVNTNVESDYSSATKAFDFCVAYSVQDSDFVQSSLAPILDSCSGKVFLQHRDVPAGVPTSDLMSLVTDSSERFVVVLSESYIQSELQNLKPILQRNGINHDKVLFLLVEHIGNPLLSRHADLCQWLSCCPIIRWGSPGFINHLRFFLSPSSVMTFQRNFTMRTNFPTLQRQISDENDLKQTGNVANFCHPVLFPGNQSLAISERLAVSNLAESRPCDKVAGKKNLELVLRVEPSTCRTLQRSQLLPAACHSYSNSTSSGQQLLSANEAEEYLV